MKHGDLVLMLLMTSGLVYGCGPVDDGSSRRSRAGIVKEQGGESDSNYWQYIYFIDEKYDDARAAKYLEAAIARMREVMPDHLAGREYLALVVMNLKEHTSAENFDAAMKLGCVVPVAELTNANTSAQSMLSGAVVSRHPIHSSAGARRWVLVDEHLQSRRGKLRSQTESAD